MQDYARLFLFTDHQSYIKVASPHALRPPPAAAVEALLRPGCPGCWRSTQLRLASRWELTQGYLKVNLCPLLLSVVVYS